MVLELSEKAIFWLIIGVSFLWGFFWVPMWVITVGGGILFWMQKDEKL